MLPETTLKDAIEKAEHYKAIGHTEICLADKAGLKPWKFATSVKDGLSMRLGVPTSFKVSAQHPCGLTFYWYEDLENNDANGTGTLAVAQESMRVFVRKLPLVARETFSLLLKEKILHEAVARADEISAASERQQASVKCLQELYRFCEQPTQGTDQ